jgi:hypothetical protein
MASIVSDRKGGMLRRAAATIEALSRQAMSTKQRYHRQ